MKRASSKSRLSRIRVLMLCSQLLLACFMVYWLRSEYFGEERILRKDMLAQLDKAQERLSDSVMTVTLVDPIMKDLSHGAMLKDSGPAADSGKRPRSQKHIPSTSKPLIIDEQVNRLSRQHSGMLVTDSITTIAILNQTGGGLSGAPVQSGKIDLRDTISELSIRPSLTPDLPNPGKQKAAQKHLTFMLRRNGEDPHAAYPGIDSAASIRVNPTITRGVRLLINESNKLLQNTKLAFVCADTPALRKRFQEAITKSGYPLGSRWVPSAQVESKHRFLLDAKNIPGKKMEILFYAPYLLRRIIPQMLFSLVLLSLTALAFFATFRSLRSQTHLAAIRNELISNMSHELKTPVATVKVALEALSEPAMLDDRVTAREYIRMATLEIGRLELLVNQSLQSSVLEDGRVHMQREPIDLKRLVEELIRTMQPRFLQAGAGVSVNGHGADFHVSADKLLLQGVVMNILDNALKYAGPAPSVKIDISEDAGRVRLSISDNGPGILPAYASRIFEKFFRVPRNNEHSVKGYGLGLSYAAQVMVLHGGSISMQPSPEGGCDFVLLFERTGA